MTALPSSGRRAALGLALAALACTSCGRGVLEEPDVPASVARAGGGFTDMAPRWSHDGRRIAFLRATPDRRYQLWVASADLRRASPILAPDLVNPDRPLNAASLDARAPEGLSWAPGDGAIAFGRAEWFAYGDDDRVPGTGIWSCDLRARAAIPLAVHPKRYGGPFSYFRSPAWSPDGRRVAYVGESVPGSTALYVRTLAGATPAGVLPRYDQYGDADRPVWSPDGRLIAYRQGILRAPTADPVETIRILEPGGARSAEVFRTTPAAYAAAMSLDPDDVTPRVGGIAWSPDGARLAFALSPRSRAPERCEIWVADLSGAAPAARVSPRDGRGYLSPVWLDDRSIGALSPESGGYRVVALSLTGGVRALGMARSGDVDWSPDRRSLVCATPGAASDGRTTTLTLVRVDRR